MAFQKEQSEHDIPLDEKHPLLKRLMKIADEGNLTIAQLKMLADTVLHIGVEGISPEDIIDARDKVHKLIRIEERKSEFEERKMLENEGKLVELGKRLPQSSSNAPYGKLATVTPLFKKEAIETIVEPAVIAQSVEKPRNHLRLIK